jgi:hypothetical protein
MCSKELFQHATYIGTQDEGQPCSFFLQTITTKQNINKLDNYQVKNPFKTFDSKDWNNDSTGWNYLWGDWGCDDSGGSFAFWQHPTKPGYGRLGSVLAFQYGAGTDQLMPPWTYTSPSCPSIVMVRTDRPDVAKPADCLVPVLGDAQNQFKGCQSGHWFSYNIPVCYDRDYIAVGIVITAGGLNSPEIKPSDYYCINKKYLLSAPIDDDDSVYLTIYNRALRRGLGFQSWVPEFKRVVPGCHLFTFQDAEKYIPGYYLIPDIDFLQCCSIAGITAQNPYTYDSDSVEHNICEVKGYTITNNIPSPSCNSLLQNHYSSGQNLISADGQTYCTTQNCDSILSKYCSNPDNPKINKDTGVNICACFDTNAWNTYKKQVESEFPAIKTVNQWDDPECSFPLCTSLPSYRHSNRALTTCPATVSCFETVSINNNGQINGDITIKQTSDCENIQNRDCIMGDWGECDKPCGTGTQTRKVKEPSIGDGNCYYPLSRPCNTQVCSPDDCDFTWSDWSTCSSDCKGGTRTRKPIIIKQAQPAGLQCPDPQTEACNSDIPCDVVNVDAKKNTSTTPLSKGTIFIFVVLACAIIGVLYYLATRNTQKTIDQSSSMQSSSVSSTPSSIPPPLSVPVGFR